MEFRSCYVAFQSLADPALTVAAKFRVPDAAERPVPAVLICHGSDGVDVRGAFHTRHLNAAGFATLEVDMWAARGTARGPGARPGLPTETMADAFGAAAFLAQQPEIDAAHLGIMGFSWGGVVSMLAATRRYAEKWSDRAPAFRAHAPFYPVCWAYNNVPGLEFDDLAGTPVLIQCGDADTYDDPDGCEKLVASLSDEARNHVRAIVYPGATHAFDRNLPGKTIDDPFAHKGAGGPVPLQFNPDVAERAAAETVAFFREHLAG